MQLSVTRSTHTHTLTVHNHIPRAPNVGIGGSMIASGGQDSQVLIFKQSSPSDPWTSTVLNKFPDVVWRVSWSVTGNILAV